MNDIINVQKTTENQAGKGETQQLKIQNPHDKFFKETLGNIATAQDFLVNYLPDQIMNAIDINTHLSRKNKASSVMN